MISIYNKRSLAGQAHVIPDAGHVVIEEQPEQPSNFQNSLGGRSTSKYSKRERKGQNISG